MKRAALISIAIIVIAMISPNAISAPLSPDVRERLVFDTTTVMGATIVRPAQKIRFRFDEHFVQVVPTFISVGSLVNTVVLEVYHSGPTGIKPDQLEITIEGKRYTSESITYGSIGNFSWEQDGGVVEKLLFYCTKLPNERVFIMMWAAILDGLPITYNLYSEFNGHLSGTFGTEWNQAFKDISEYLRSR